VVAVSFALEARMHSSIARDFSTSVARSKAPARALFSVSPTPGASNAIFWFTPRDVQGEDRGGRDQARVAGRAPRAARPELHGTSLALRDAVPSDVVPPAVARQPGVPVTVICTPERSRFSWLIPLAGGVVGGAVALAAAVAWGPVVAGLLTHSGVRMLRGAPRVVASAAGLEELSQTALRRLAKTLAERAHRVPGAAALLNISDLAIVAYFTYRAIAELRDGDRRMSSADAPPTAPLQRSTIRPPPALP
jgi:hypothetical protein